MFRFPRDPERRRKWAAKVKRQNWIPSAAGAYLCEARTSSEIAVGNRINSVSRLILKATRSKNERMDQES